MIIDKRSQLLRCPHCGTLKAVISLVSGNTFGMTKWSDGAYEAPMLPCVSYVQQCPSCQKYFFFNKDVEAGMTRHISSSQTGKLPYQNLKEAFEQLQPKGDDERFMRRMLVWAYNDYRETQHSFIEQEREHFLNNVEALLQLSIEPIFRAELLREIERFDECIAVLNTIENEKLKHIKEAILQKSKEKDSEIFRLCGDATRRPLLSICEIPYDKETDVPNVPYPGGDIPWSEGNSTPTRINYKKISLIIIVVILFLLTIVELRSLF